MSIRLKVFTAVMVTMFGGCSVDVGKQTIELVDRAITALTTNSADWQNVLRDTVAKLSKDAESFVQVELNNLLGRTVAATGAEVRCLVDFAGKRVLQGLLNIRARLLNQQVPPTEPMFCAVNPGQVRMAERNQDPNRFQAVEVHGYDFDTQPAIQLLLRDNNVVTDVTAGNLTRQTHYQMTLNIGGNGVPLSARSQILYLAWNGRPVVEIPVIQPHAPPCQPRLVSLDTIGSHEVRAVLEAGDPEFGNNQPLVSAGVDLTNHGSHVSAEIWIRAWEANGGDTVGSGRSVINIYSAPSDWQVLRIVTPRSDAIDPYHDTTWGEDRRIRAGNGPVSAFHLWGDTHYWDVEPDRDDGTRVVVDFRRVNIEIVKSGSCP